MSSRYFYQIKPEVATLALHTQLEFEEINLIEIVDTARIKKTMQEFYRFFGESMLPLIINPINLPILNILTRLECRNLRDLRHEISERTNSLRNLTLYGNSANIKLSQENLERTLAVSVQICTNYYNQNLLPRMDEKMITNFWIEKMLSPSDFLGLSVFFYTKIFGDGFFGPLELSDNDFVLEVDQPSLRDAFDHYPLGEFLV